MSLNWNGKKPVVDCSKDKGFTVQADRDDADINLIIARYEKAGNMNRLAQREPFYGDVTGFDGLAEAYMKVKESEELFMEFDAKIRERFNNNPVEFVEFFEDPGNLEEAIELGIAKPKPTPPPPTPPASPAPVA